MNWTFSKSHKFEFIYMKKLLILALILGSFIANAQNVATIPIANTTYFPTETRANSTGGSVTTHATEVDVPGASITLPAGTYEIGYDVGGVLDNNGSGNVVLSVRITDASNSVLVGSGRVAVTSTYVTGYSGAFQGSASYHSLPITLSSTTTYKLRMTKSTSGGTPNTAQGMALTANSYIYAKRIK